ncbi:hypothetical protein AOLI_G00038430 [Acnodon oligacanthus]
MAGCWTCVTLRHLIGKASAQSQKTIALARDRRWVMGGGVVRTPTGSPRSRSYWTLAEQALLGWWIILSTAVTLRWWWCRQT